MNVFEKGQIWFAKDKASFGDNNEKTRTWIIINPKIGGGNVMAIPISSSPMGIPIEGITENKTLYAQITITHTVHCSKFIKYFGTLPASEFEKIQNALRFVFLGEDDMLSDEYIDSYNEFIKYMESKDIGTRGVYGTQYSSFTDEMAPYVRNIRSTPIGKDISQFDYYMIEKMYKKKSTNVSPSVGLNDDTKNHTNMIQHSTMENVQGTKVIFGRNRFPSPSKELKLEHLFMLLYPTKYVCTLFMITPKTVYTYRSQLSKYHPEFCNLTTKLAWRENFSTNEFLKDIINKSKEFIKSSQIDFQTSKGVLRVFVNSTDTTSIKPDSWEFLKNHILAYATSIEGVVEGELLHKAIIKLSKFYFNEDHSLLILKEE